MWGVLAAIPLEGMASLLLRHVPRIGVAREPDPWLRLGGDLSAVLHITGLALSQFLCVEFCPPNFVLQSAVIAGGYLDSVILILGFLGAIRVLRLKSWR